MVVCELYGVQIDHTPIIPINKFKTNLWGVTLKLPTGESNLVVQAVGISGAIEEAISYYTEICDVKSNPVAVAVFDYSKNEKVWWIRRK